jgi:dihydroorotase-like cyclic amidohydrolase
MQDKDRYKDEPQKVPCGIAGIGTMRQSLIDGLVQTGKIRTDYLTRLIHDNPAKMIRSIR